MTDSTNRPVDRHAYLGDVRGVVVKIGTQALCNTAGTIDPAVIQALTADLAQLVTEDDIRVTLVSSGAIGAGVAEMGLAARPKELPMLQAAAAVGQSVLMNIFAAALEPYSLHAGQILVSRDDFENRLRYLNLRNCIHALQRSKSIPIINENDAVTVDEIRFGDNDLIAAHITNLVQADILILLSVVDGLLDAQGRVQTVVRAMDDGVAAMVRPEKSLRGSGGMNSKLVAAGTVKTAGVPVIIANGKIPGIVQRLLNGEDMGTLILPDERRLSARSRWIGLTARPRGTLVVDAGAAVALNNNKSLLASGIVAANGNFARGDPVAITDADGRVLAHGLCNYSREDVDKIRGHKTREFEALLGSDTFYDEVVHRDDLVLRG
jgi:glutamate 5-kinase